jgi:polyisoprenoid-binding protein YceI
LFSETLGLVNTRKDKELMTLPLAPGTWVLDTAHTTVAFTVRHMGISKVRGTFARVEARLTVGDSLEGSTLTARVDMSSVDTGNPDRDSHLRSPDFFDIEKYPTMDYASTAIREDGAGGYLVDGVLTLNGRSNALPLAVEFHGTETYPMDGSTHAGFSASATLSRKDYGIEFNVPMAAGGFVIGDRVSIDLEVQLAALSAEQAA